MNSEQEVRSAGSQGLVVVRCVDSSVWMTLARVLPIGSKPYQKLWSNIERRIHEGGISAPDEVLAEIEQGRDDLRDWANAHRDMFRSPSPRMVDEVKRLVATHGQPFAGRGKTGPHADPWLVALAIHETNLFQTVMVVCDEKRTPGRVPAVCDKEKVECIDHTEWFEQEGWGFA